MTAVKTSNGGQAKDVVHEAAMKETAEVLQLLGTSPSGLTESEAIARLVKYGSNEVAQERKHETLHRLWLAVRNPLVILLTILATVSYATGDLRAGTVMLLMVILGLGLRFIQESRADAAA